MRRLSRGTPYILPSADIDNALRSIAPHTAHQIATVIGLTIEEWYALDDRLKVKHLIDYQNSAVLAATVVAAARAHTDLDDVANPATVNITSAGPMITQRAEL